jgi:hypothetical protein
LNPNDISRVWGIKADVSHDGDKHVLLLVERTRVQTPSVTETSELLGGQNPLQEFSGGVTPALRLEIGISGRLIGDMQNLNDVGTDADTGLTNTEELVDERTAEGK